MSTIDEYERMAKICDVIKTDNTQVIINMQKTIDELKAERLEDARIIGKSSEREAKHLATIAEQAKQIKTLREALKFYTEEKAYFCDCNHPATKGRVVLDKGMVARQALAATEKE